MGPYLCTSILFTNMKAAQQCLNTLGTATGYRYGKAALQGARQCGQVNTPRTGKIQAFCAVWGRRPQLAGALAGLSSCSGLTIFFPILSDSVIPSEVDLVIEEASCCSQGEGHHLGCTGLWISWGPGLGASFLGFHT